MVPKPRRRPSIPTDEALKVWVASAGRCAFCNAFVLESDTLGIPIKIAELAHIVGWDLASPRGDDPLPLKRRQDAENLMLACRNCHKPVDGESILDLYTIEELRQRKFEHESDMKRLTGLAKGRDAFVVRVVSDIRSASPELTRRTVLEAVTRAGYYPQVLPWSHWEGLEADLRPLGELASASDLEGCLPQIKALARRVHDAVAQGEMSRLAIFGFARIPVLVALGAELDDKVETLVFQRHRVDGANAWTWPADPRATPTFEVQQVVAGAANQVALVINMSGHIPLTDLPATVVSSHTVYALQPVEPAEAGVGLIDSPEALAAFEAECRAFLQRIEGAHGRLPSLALFASVGVAAAVTLGRVLMPDVSPTWHVYDRTATGAFEFVLEVSK